MFIVNYVYSDVTQGHKINMKINLMMNSTGLNTMLYSRTIIYFSKTRLLHNIRREVYNNNTQYQVKDLMIY